MLESYAKAINIEILTMIDMAQKDILPAISKFTGKLSKCILSKKAVSKSIKCTYEESILEKLSSLEEAMVEEIAKLEKILENAKGKDALALATMFKDEALVVMDKLRAAADEAECITDRTFWPYPSYADLLFGVQ
jgi:glutamine synthetase